MDLTLREWLEVERGLQLREANCKMQITTARATKNGRAAEWAAKLVDVQELLDKVSKHVAALTAAQGENKDK